MLQVVILAGGLATRLLPVTEKIPKSLVEVAGFPFIHHQLVYLKKQGINEVVICLGHMGEMVKEFVSKRSYGLSISFSFDGQKQLGTGGAIKNALSILKDRFFILYGDSFLPINYSKVYQALIGYQDYAVMTIMRNNNKYDVSNVKIISENIIFYNKNSPSADMEYIDYGLSIISKKMIKDFHADYIFDLADLMQSISTQKKLLGFEVFERFYEIGSHDGLTETREYFDK
jgi:NDP-sugar pyrophosphorylase family protein